MWEASIVCCRGRHDLFCVCSMRPHPCFSERVDGPFPSTHVSKLHAITCYVRALDPAYLHQEYSDGPPFPMLTICSLSGEKKVKFHLPLLSALTLDLQVPNMYTLCTYCASMYFESYNAPPRNKTFRYLDKFAY